MRENLNKHGQTLNNKRTQQSALLGVGWGGGLQPSQPSAALHQNAWCWRFVVKPSVGTVEEYSGMFQRPLLAAAPRTSSIVVLSVRATVVGISEAHASPTRANEFCLCVADCHDPKAIFLFLAPKH